MNYLIHEGHTSSIKNCLASDNVRHLCYIIEFSNNIDSSTTIISLDAKKAFDHLDRHFLWSVLHCMGFDHHYDSSYLLKSHCYGTDREHLF